MFERDFDWLSGFGALVEPVGLLAAVIVGKYRDHLPLYRQEQIYATRHRVRLPRQCVAR